MKSTSIDTKVHAFLHNRYAASKNYQEGEGRVFDISFQDYCKIWKRSRYKFEKLKEHVIMNTAWEFMASDDGYVLTWKNKNAFKTGIINAETMEIKTRKMSIRVCHMQAGDTHRPESIEKIRKARTGTIQSEETRQSIGKALKGRPKSDEHKARMREAALARHARRREQAKIYAGIYFAVPLNGKSAINQSVPAK